MDESVHFDVDLLSYCNKIFVAADRKEEQSRIKSEKTEWPLCYPSLDYLHSQEALEKAKAGWMETGKVYHLLSKDEQNNPITKEYPEYSDGENKFIVVKEYDTFHLRSVKPIVWKHDNEGKLIFEGSNSFNMWADITDLPQNLGDTKFEEKVLKDYLKKFFAQEIYPDQRYENNPPILDKELANKNFALQQENHQLKEENKKLKDEKKALEEEKKALEEEKKRLQQEKEEQQREIEKLTKNLDETKKENSILQQKAKVCYGFIRKVSQASIFKFFALKRSAKGLDKSPND